MKVEIFLNFHARPRLCDDFPAFLTLARRFHLPPIRRITKFNCDRVNLSLIEKLIDRKILIFFLRGSIFELNLKKIPK